jgi:hypothetical protein
MTSSSLAHDYVASLVVDDNADADEGSLGLRHGFQNALFVELGEVFRVGVK